MENKSERHIRIYESLKSARATIEEYWQELMYYTLPRKAYITRIKSLGDRLPSDIYDSTAIMANAYFAAGMQAYISSPQTKWFTLGLKNRGLMKNKAVIDYLRDTEDALTDIINNSNFYQEDVEGYLNMGSIGSDILYCEEDLKTDVNFDSVPIENIVVTVDAQGRINGAYIEYEFTAEQALGKFGQAAGSKPKEAYEKSDYAKKFKYLFCVYLRDIYDQSKLDSKNMPYASLWINKEEKNVVSEKGFREFPFFLSRFAKGKGDPYGYSIAMNILPDIKSLNSMEYSNLLGGQTKVRPPLEIPDEAFLKPYDLNPRGLNIKNTGYPNEHITPIDLGADVPFGIEYVDRKAQKISQAFYNDLFIMIEQIGKMTATEANIRNNQRMQLLGSAIGNIMREKLSPVIGRVYSIAARNGKVPELPPELIDQEYTIIYISPLARAQKALELNNMQAAIQIIASFGQVQPDVFDNIDFDEAVRQVIDITNVTPKIIRDDGEVEEIRDGRAQQDAMAMQMEMMNKGVDTITRATEADKNIAETGQPAGVK